MMGIEKGRVLRKLWREKDKLKENEIVEGRVG